MFSDEPKPNDGDTNDTNSGAREASPQQAAAAAAGEARANVVSDASAGDSPASEASATEREVADARPSQILRTTTTRAHTGTSIRSVARLFAGQRLGRSRSGSRPRLGNSERVSFRLWLQIKAVNPAES